MDRLRVYIAGSLSSDCSSRRLANVQAAMDCGKTLICHNMAPLIPHLSHFLEGWHPEIPDYIPVRLSHSTWLEVDLPWVSVADAVLRLPGESRGADLEVERANREGIPVYFSLDALISDAAAGSLRARGPQQHVPLCEQNPKPPPAGDARFHELLRQIGKLHAKKAADADPFANIRASAEWGIPPWLGALVRANDKVTRLKTFAQTGKLANEGVEDSLLDLASYALIALVLFREEKEASKCTNV